MFIILFCQLKEAKIHFGKHQNNLKNDPYVDLVFEQAWRFFR